MTDEQTAAPENTAVWVALWRAMHVQIDPPPHVLEDEIGLRLAAPDDGWRHRGDMHPVGTSRFRAGIVARARFAEDLVAEQAGNGVTQYVILGPSLDTFAQRKPELASRIRVFEVDRPGPQTWKRERLTESATTFRRGYAGCPSISRRAGRGGVGSWPLDSTPPSGRWWPP